MELFAFFDSEGILVFAGIAALAALVLVCAYLRERPQAEDDHLERQRRMPGSKPGAGANNRGRALPRQVFPKRCPRGICTAPGASCPRECVKEPLVRRLVDGRVVHEYDNVEVCFGPGNRVLELKVDCKAWL